MSNVSSPEVRAVREAEFRETEITTKEALAEAPEWEPVGSSVMVRLFEAVRILPGSGLVVPDSASDPCRRRAIVIKTGEGCVVDGVWVSQSVQPGDEVLLAKNVGVPLNGKDEDLFRLISHKHIMGKKTGDF